MTEVTTLYNCFPLVLLVSLQFMLFSHFVWRSRLNDRSDISGHFVPADSLGTPTTKAPKGT